MYQGKFKAKTSNNHPACIKLQKLVSNTTTAQPENSNGYDVSKILETKEQSQFQDKKQRKHTAHQ